MNLQIALLIVFLMLSAFFSASEAAFLSVSKIQVRRFIRENRAGSSALERIKKNPRRIIVTLLIGNNLVNTAISALFTVITIKIFGSATVGIATGIVTLTLLVFGEITPKSIATVHAEKIALATARPLEIISYVFFPVGIIFEKGVSLITKSKKMESGSVEAELKSLIEIGHEEGQVKAEEKELIENVLQFNDITVREVMTHRNEMIMLEASLLLKDAVQQMIENGFSRYPVYEKTKDNIIGIALMRDILIKLVEGKENEKLASFVKPTPFVTQHKIINDLFKELQEKQTHMAIVANDHGEVVGLVTVEDLLEELVGEIIDESDVKENLIKRIDKNKILVHGRTELKYINRFFHTTLPGKPTDTISSIILKQIKRFPKQGEIVTINRNDLLIAEKTPKEITKVEITKNYD